MQSSRLKFQIIATLAALVVPSAPAWADPTVALTRVLAQYVFTLDRPLTTFHYEQEPSAYQSTYDPKTLSDVDHHVTQLIERFHADTIGIGDNTELGPGAYVAMDPLASVAYGGSRNPQLYVITLVEGTRLLDFGTPPPDDQTTWLRTLLQRQRCAPDDLILSRNFIGLLGVARGSAAPECRRMIRDAFVALGIQGALYPYLGLKLKGCRQRGYAINIISSAAIDHERIALFTDQRKIAPPSLLPNLAELLRESKESFGNSFDDFIARLYLPPLTLTRLVEDSGEYEAWKSALIYGCGPRRSSEKH